MRNCPHPLSPTAIRLTLSHSDRIDGVVIAAILLFAETSVLATELRVLQWASSTLREQATIENACAATMQIERQR